MNCIIVEDLKIAADYLARCCKRSGLVKLAGSFEDVPSAVAFLNEHTVDLLFLDVEMPGASGFDLLDSIPYKPKVILTTSKEEYAYNAFQYHIEDFLKKPFTYPRFLEALSRVSEDQRQSGDEDFLFIKTENKLVRLKYDDILYIESMNNYVRFVTQDKTYVNYNTLKSLEDRLKKDNFIRVHRSFIININKISDILETGLHINGKEIPLSPALKAEVMKKLTIL